MRKGSGLSQLDKVRMRQCGLEVCWGFPLRHTDETKPGVRVESTMQPRREIALLPLHKIPRGLPALQKLFLFPFRHFERINQDDTCHGPSPFLQAPCGATAVIHAEHALSNRFRTVSMRWTAAVNSAVDKPFASSFAQAPWRRVTSAKISLPRGVSVTSFALRWLGFGRNPTSPSAARTSAMRWTLCRVRPIFLAICATGSGA